MERMDLEHKQILLLDRQRRIGRRKEGNGYFGQLHARI